MFHETPFEQVSFSEQNLGFITSIHPFNFSQVSFNRHDPVSSFTFNFMYPIKTPRTLVVSSFPPTNLLTLSHMLRIARLHGETAVTFYVFAFIYILYV